jgi:hypothetical protein
MAASPSPSVAAAVCAQQHDDGDDRGGSNLSSPLPLPSSSCCGLLLRYDHDYPIHAHAEYDMFQAGWLGTTAAIAEDTPGIAITRQWAAKVHTVDPHASVAAATVDIATTSIPHTTTRNHSKRRVLCASDR